MNINISTDEIKAVGTALGVILTAFSGAFLAMHKQAMKKFDAVINAQNKTNEIMTDHGKQIAVHNSQLKSGNVQFDKIENNLKEHSHKIALIDTRVAVIEQLKVK